MEIEKLREMTKTVDTVRERERESNKLEKIALVCDAENNAIKDINKNTKSIMCATIMTYATSIICITSVCEKHTKILVQLISDKIKRIDYIANRRKEKLLFAG